MKIDRINVKRGKKLNLGNYESTSLELGMEVLLEEDDPHDTINGLYRILNQHLDAWERTEKGTNALDQQPVVETADTIRQPVEIIQKPTSSSIAKENNKSKDLICPKCHEIMVQKDGKDYYVCKNHWGYPDMIENGEVRDKRF